MTDGESSYTYDNDTLTGISVANGAYYTLEHDAFGRVTKTKVGTRLLSERIYDTETGLLTRQNYGTMWRMVFSIGKQTCTLTTTARITAW